MSVSPAHTEAVSVPPDLDIPTQSQTRYSSLEPDAIADHMDLELGDLDGRSVLSGFSDFDPAPPAEPDGLSDFDPASPAQGIDDMLDDEAFNDDNDHVEPNSLEHLQNAIDNGFFSPVLSTNGLPTEHGLGTEHVQNAPFLDESASNRAIDNDAVDSVVGTEDTDPDDCNGDLFPLPCLRPYEQGAFGPVFEHSADWDKYNIEGYDKHIFYCINHDKTLVLPDNATREVKLHRERCVLMTRFFDEDTYAETKDVHFDPGSTIADWNEYWEEEREQWVGRTLVHIYFNGKSRKTHGNKKEFWW